MSEELLVLQSVKNGVITIELNRPDARNALSTPLREQLAAAINAADADPDVRVVLIVGQDEQFAAGADIKLMSEVDLVGAMDMARGRSIFQTVAECTKPVVVGVSGFALGAGFELALAADIIVASESAQFGLPEVTLGIIPGGGGTQRLARIVGKQKAMELVLTGMRIGSRYAEELGIVNVVAGRKENWREKASDLAEVIAKRPPVAVRLAKQAVNAAFEDGMTGGLAYERRLFELAMATDDRVEGMTAFIDKRPPEFKGQ
ncbi:MAG: enoyl-CoA hydratase/isomerase family protein [Thermoleophilaceae bacterium]|nr:enoyl-CoA hydratase/isomerase family protein [Thermoleophilaceae bacterium]